VAPVQVNRVSEVVTSLADPSANVIFGAVIEDAYEGEVHVTIIATGFTQSFEDALLSGKTPVRAPLRLFWQGAGARPLAPVLARRRCAPPCACFGGPCHP
jgi:cell division protein FtsZ